MAWRRARPRHEGWAPREPRRGARRHASPPAIIQPGLARGWGEGGSAPRRAPRAALACADAILAGVVARWVACAGWAHRRVVVSAVVSAGTHLEQKSVGGSGCVLTPPSSSSSLNWRRGRVRGNWRQAAATGLLPVSDPGAVRQQSTARSSAQASGARRSAVARSPGW